MTDVLVVGAGPTGEASVEMVPPRGLVLAIGFDSVVSLEPSGVIIEAA